MLARKQRGCSRKWNSGANALWPRRPNCGDAMKLDEGLPVMSETDLEAAERRLHLQGRGVTDETETSGSPTFEFHAYSRDEWDRQPTFGVQVQPCECECGCPEVADSDVLCLRCKHGLCADDDE